jgi:hypothetical protein
VNVGFLKDGCAVLRASHLCQHLIPAASGGLRRRSGGGLQLRHRPLPDLLMHYLLNVAPQSELAAKHLIGWQLRVLSAASSPPSR